MVAFVTTVFAEAIQMLIILAISRPFADAVALVQVIAIPMIVTSSVGAALFMSIIRDQRNTYDKAAATFSARAFKIAERTLNILGKGFNRETALDIANIIREENRCRCRSHYRRETGVGLRGRRFRSSSSKFTDFFASDIPGYPREQGPLH